MHSNRVVSNKIRGFTLIELLVVVSIISLLSSIILAALSRARNSAADSSIAQEMNQLPIAALLFTKNGNDFTNQAYDLGNCGNFATEPILAYPDFQKALTQAIRFGGDPSGSLSDAACFLSSSWWLVMVPLKSNPNTSYCVDSQNDSTMEPVSPSTALTNFGNQQQTSLGASCNGAAISGHQAPP